MTGEFAVAVHAMVYLYHKGCSLSSEELALNVCTNPARIRKVTSKLKKAGLLETREGAEGGCSIIEGGGRISLSRILDALEESIVTPGWRSGREDAQCLICAGMAGMMEGLCVKMDDICRDYLDTVTIADLEQILTGKK